MLFWLGCVDGRDCCDPGWADGERSSLGGSEERLALETVIEGPEVEGKVQKEMESDHRRGNTGYEELTSPP